MASEHRPPYVRQFQTPGRYLSLHPIARSPHAPLTSFLTTAIVFLVADAIMLRSVIQPSFRGTWATSSTRAGSAFCPALLFYVSNMLGILYFASAPRASGGRAVAGASERGDPRARGLWLLRVHVLGRHAGLASADGGVDLAWGTVLTAGAAWGGVVITRAIMG
jgi:uncharacterized membrane protein